MCSQWHKKRQFKKAKKQRPLHLSFKCKWFHVGPTVAVSSVNSPDCNLSIAKSSTKLMRAKIIPRTSRNIQSLPRRLQQGRHLSKIPGQNKGETNQGWNLSKKPWTKTRGKQIRGDTSRKNLDKTKGKQIRGDTSQKTLDRTKGKQIRGETSQKTLDKNTGETNQGRHLSKNLGQKHGETNQGQHL